MDQLNAFVQHELTNKDNNISRLSDHILFDLKKPQLKNIHYVFDYPKDVNNILVVFPPVTPEQIGAIQVSLPAAHPVVNHLFNTPLNFPQPLVLYFDNPFIYHNQPFFHEYGSATYNNIHTIFDLLGAIKTYYYDLVHDNLDRLIRHDYINIRPYRNGYRVMLD